MVISIVLFFLFSALSFFITRPFQKKYGVLLGLVTLSIAIYYGSFFPYLYKDEILVYSYPWIPHLEINFSLVLDSLSLLFLFVIIGIGALVLFYSNRYLRHHHGINKFYAYLMFFIGSMVGLVLAGDLITLYLFWSLTGLASFLLIGFRHHDDGARKAAIQALVITEGGGLALLAAFILMAVVVGHHDIPRLLSDAGELSRHPWFNSILLLILLGAFTKSAQFPFHFWLPSAMKAPTPVSAYLHSASMVNAGVYIVARLSPLFDQTLLWKNLLLTAGIVTFFIGVYFSLTRRDIKSILAYTTISALGLMIFLLGVGTSLAVNAALLYLVIHALYKSSLFMMAGIIDRESGVRDIYQVAGLWKGNKLAAGILILALLSMAGLPPLLGYVGKELIYEVSLHSVWISTAMVILVVFSNACMLFISAILGYELIFSSNSSKRKSVQKVSFEFLMAPAILALLGLILTLFPEKFESLLMHSVESTGEMPIEVDLKIWHGFTKEFVLTLITFGLGIVLFIARKPILNFLNRINRILFSISFSTVFFKAASLVSSFSAKFTLFIQHGYQRLYLLIIFSVTALFLGYFLWSTPIHIPRVPDHYMIGYVAGISILIVGASILAVLNGSKLSAIITMGVVGYGIAIIHFMFSAIDLAITQLLIETLLLIVMVMVMYKLPQIVRYSSWIVRLRDGIVAIVFGGCITASLWLLHAQPTKMFDVGHMLAQKSFLEAHGRNIVNVILVDFRALDTLGEISVVMIAAVGILTVLGYKKKNNQQ